MEKDKKIKMTAKYEGTCSACQNKIRKDTPIVWCPDRKIAWHASCNTNKTRNVKKRKKKIAQTNKAQRALNTARPARGSARFFRF